MTRLPFKKVKIHPFTFQIIEVPGLTTEDQALAGSFEGDSQTIYINPDHHPEQIRDTLLHEVLHVLWSQTASEKQYTEQEEEAIVWSITPRLLAWMKDNPQIMAWLLGR